ncbi:probable BOI-related E3 ubiquitin-protein ligase 3 [Henckelia pumila]|uniref:probable BOI-related E3 ubiquitin-protein ligase 3 n=1 Tax=Henckelia pumila TaxID=405737 RepID=UPI003C6E86FB
MAIQAQLVSDQSFGFPLGALHHHHDSAMETGGGSSFIHHSSSFLIPQHNQLMHFQNPNPVKDHHEQSVLFSQFLSSQIDNQRMEIDRFIALQNERLRQGLQEQRKRQISTMMKKYESKIQSLLKHKDQEIFKARNRRMELENILQRMEIENQTWQTAAKEKEAMAASLNSKIQRLKETACLSMNAAEDAESSCFRSEDQNELEQNTRKMICRCCASRKACVIILPCRHLCSCKDCDPFLDSCPVCKTVKKATLEAFTL